MNITANVNTVGKVTGRINTDASLQGRISHIVNDYTMLENKPKINGVTLVGDKPLSDFNMVSTEQLEAKADKTTLSADITLAAADWTDDKTQTAAVDVDMSRLNTPIPNVSSLKEYASCGVYLTDENESGFTFACDSIPKNDLVLKIKSEVAV